jgi:hypothetical protein
MIYIEGKMLAGEFDSDANEFTLQKVKHHYTETTLKKNQLDSIYVYLQNHSEEDFQVLSLFDQMLIRLSQQDVRILLEDLKEIQVRYR